MGKREIKHLDPEFVPFIQIQHLIQILIIIKQLSLGLHGQLQTSCLRIHKTSLGLYIVIERLIDHTNLTYILQILQIKPEVLTPVKLGITLKSKSPDNVCLVKLIPENTLVKVSRRRHHVFGKSGSCQNRSCLYMPPHHDRPAPYPVVIRDHHFAVIQKRSPYKLLCGMLD